MAPAIQPHVEVLRSRTVVRLLISGSLMVMAHVLSVTPLQQPAMRSIVPEPALPWMRPIAQPNYVVTPVWQTQRAEGYSNAGSRLSPTIVAAGTMAAAWCYLPARGDRPL